MSTPAQMFDNDLNPVKGWPSPYAVDKAADVADSDVAITRGSVMSLDASGNFALGLAVDAMAIFALNNSNDFDVVGDDGNLVGNGTSTPRMSGLVAVGAYELESSAFDTAGSYAPNSLLTSPVPGAADAGELQAGTKFTDTICGVVSDGAITNENSLNVIRFWPVWLPTT